MFLRGVTIIFEENKFDYYQAAILESEKHIILGVSEEGFKIRFFLSFLQKNPKDM